MHSHVSLTHHNSLAPPRRRRQVAALAVSLATLSLAGLTGTQVAHAAEMVSVTATEHARMSSSMKGMDMSHGMPGKSHNSIPGKAQGSMKGMDMKNGMPGKGQGADHRMPGAATTGMNERHGPASHSTRWVIIGAFAILIAVALAAAAVLRRRGPAVKRRQMLARVRASATTPSTPSDR
jgi:hypothetical protein